MLKIKFMLLLILFCNEALSADTVDPHKHHKMNHGQNMEKSSMANLDGDSVYNLDALWTSRDNKKVRLQDFKSKVVVLTMVYTSCTFVCPTLILDMKHIFNKLPKKYKNTSKFVLVSIDPKRDTPSQLKKYGKKMKLGKEWELLTGSEDAALELAAVLGVKYKKTINGEYSHSNIISILDREGVLKHQQVGLNTKPKASIDLIKKL